LDYYKTQPWFAFPHGDKRKETLSSKFGVGGIPWLVILDKNGKVVQNEADGTVMQDGEDAIKQWIQ
jgi:nucleoredoxin